MKFYEFNEDEKRIDIFNERFYKIGDKFYRNVTTILGIIDKGYNYAEWLKQTGYNSEIIVDRAGKFGSAFHELVERFLLKETVKYHDNNFLGDQTATALWERFIIWLDFWKELNKEHKVEYKPEGVEYICHSTDYEYAGTVDLVAKVDGSVTLFDWKTGNYVGEKEKLQLTAYMFCLMKGQAKIIHIPAKKPNKKGYRITDVPFDTDMFDLFIATKRLFDNQNKDKPKVLTLPLEVNLESLTKE